MSEQNQANQPQCCSSQGNQAPAPAAQPNQPAQPQQAPAPKKRSRKQKV